VIDNFLTEEECDHVINKSLNNGMFDSSLHIDPDTRRSKQYTIGKEILYQESYLFKKEAEYTENFFYI